MMKRDFPGDDVVADIGEGWDFRRTGLLKLLQLAMNDQVSEVVVMHPDELSVGVVPHVMTLLEAYGVSVCVHSSSSSS